MVVSQQDSLTSQDLGYPKSGKNGGLLVYVNSNIPSKMLKIPDCPSDIQVMPV